MDTGRVELPLRMPGWFRVSSLFLLFSLIAILEQALVPTLLLAQSFRNPYRIPTLTDPGGIAIGDLNGDGTADFVWLEGNFTAATLHVLLSQPSGGWLPGNDIPIAGPITRFTDCLLVDVNGDKRLDLICADADEFVATILVFPGNGDGTFQAPIATGLPTSGDGNWVDPFIYSEGDLNGDGIPDFYAIDEENNRADILLGDGHGGFNTPISAPIATNWAPPVAADVNGDGIPDLLFSFGPEVALGKGDGSFGLISSYTAPSYYDAYCTYHDMDGDGHLDAVCGYAETITGDITGATDLIILHGNPDGSFNTTPIAQKRFGDYDNEYDGYGTFLTPLAVADLNGDGIPDVLGASGDGLAVLLGGPSLTFSTPLHYARATAGPGYDYASPIYDVNGDGIPDLVDAGPSGIYISYGHHDGTYGSAFAPEVTEHIAFPTVADFNGDGIPDIAATGDTAIKLSIGKGDGTFAPQIALSSQNGALTFSGTYPAGPAYIVHGDFNGDGNQDLLALGSPGSNLENAYLFFGIGNGTFRDPILVPNSFSFGSPFTSMTDQDVSDLNHDGRSDVFEMEGSGTYGATTAQIAVALSVGDGTFQTVDSTVPVDQSNSFSFAINPALADFDGDGKLDAVYGSVSNVYVVKGHGDGTFSSAATAVLPIPSISGQAPQETVAVATGDFDGDGNQDFVVLAEYPSVAAWVYFGDGKGNFAAPVSAGNLDQNFTNIAASDLNHDGLSDIVLWLSDTSYEDFAVGVIDSQAGRTFAPVVDYTAGTGLRGLAIADMNQDGRPDLVFGNGGSNPGASSVTELINLGPTPQVTGNLFARPEPSVVTQAFTLTATLSPPSPATLSGSVAFQIDGAPVGSAPLTANTATLPLAGNLSVGQHTLSAAWPGDTTYQSLALVGTHNVIAAQTNTTVTSSQNPAPVGTNITFTVTVSSAYGTPTGSVALTDNGATLSTINLVNGSGTYSTSALAVGTHNIGASFAANGNFAAGSASLSQVIQGQPSTTKLVGAPNPAYADQTVNLTATVTAASGTPTGTVTFYDGGALLGTATLSGGSAGISATFNAAGMHSLTANYSGDQTFSPGTGTFSETVNLNPTAMTDSAVPNPAIALQPIAFGATVTAPAGVTATGSVIFTANGTQIGSGVLQNGQAAFSDAGLAAGSYQIVASYAGDSASAPSSAAPFTLVVAQQASQVHLATSLNPAPLGTSVTFTAAVSAAKPFSGTVQFYDGANALGSPVSVSSTGTAIYTTSALALGTHNITAQYSGDANTVSSVSAVLPQSIVPYVGDFSIAVTPTAMSVFTGQAATFQVTVTSIGGFNEPLSLSCGNLPAATTCGWSTSSLPNGQGTATVVIQTSAPAQVSANGAGPGLRRGPRAAGEWAVALLAVFLVPRRWKRGLWMSLLGVFILTTLSGCSSPTPIVGGTPPGIYQISITGTYTAPTPPLTHSTVAGLTVKSLF